jgi:hypothetical protein
MDIHELVSSLKEKHILKQEGYNIKTLTGGTTSKLFMLESQDSPKLILKFNKPRVIQSEVYFLKKYEDIQIFPKVLYVAETFNYMLYSYVEGLTNYPGNNKAAILKNIVHAVINHYKPVPDYKGWGWIDEPTDSWGDFLLNEVEYAKDSVNQVLNQENEILVRKLIEKFMVYEGEAFLLHGDLGIHNFLFQDNIISGVIDPTPVLGYPLYDLIYAFCSSPENLSKETIHSAASELNIGPRNSQHLNEQVLIGLFFRISSCIKHHPSDLPQYLEAWDYWKGIVTEN